MCSRLNWPRAAPPRIRSSATKSLRDTEYALQQAREAHAQALGDLANPVRLRGVEAVLRQKIAGIKDLTAAAEAAKTKAEEASHLTMSYWSTKLLFHT